MAVGFMGTFEHSIDDKGRVIVPSKLREQVNPVDQAAGFIVTHAPEGCLFLYLPDDWREISSRIEKLPKGKAGVRALQRRIFSRAEHVTLDRQGRILIPDRLRNKVGIQRDLVLAGACDRIEVWSKDAWESQADDDGDYEEQLETYLGEDEPAPATPLQES